jgi:6-phosphogluconolactonase
MKEQAVDVITYVSCAGSGEIRVLALDLRDGSLRELQRLHLGGRLMPMALHPQRTHLYVARRSLLLAAISLRIDTMGLLQPVGEAPLPASMAYVSCDRSGRFLFSASYDAHRVAVNAIDDQGIVGTVLQQLPTEPNAHAIGADPGNRFVFSTSLGGERLQRFDFDARSGRLTPHATPGVLIEPPAGGRAGPRHFVFHPNGRWLYVLHELDASVAVFAFDGANGGTTALQRIGTLPSGFDGAPWAAEIRIAADGRHLYTSERRSSTLATLAIDARTGTLTLAGRQATETQPRGFALDPTGRWLLCAGQVSGRVSSHPVHATSGALGPAAASIEVGADPNWVETLALALA